MRSVSKTIATSIAIWAFAAQESPQSFSIPAPAINKDVTEIRQLAPFQDYPEDGKPHHDPGSLPASIRAMIESAVKYRPSQFTQMYVESINGGRIEQVHRDYLYRKWNVPGGLEDVNGWKSDLYRFMPAPPRVWIGNVSLPINSTGLVRISPAQQRSYTDGTWFADVLSNKGKAFEVRVREKDEGKWSYYVAWKNKAAQPTGYSGAKQSCLSCHRLAGTGMADQGLVPGGDETMSDPFLDIE